MAEGRPQRKRTEPKRLIDEAAAKPATQRSTNKKTTTNKANTSKPRMNKTQTGRVTKPTTSKKDTAAKNSTANRKTTAPKKAAASKKAASKKKKVASAKKATFEEKAASPTEAASPEKPGSPRKSASPEKTSSSKEKGMLERASEIVQGVVLTMEGHALGKSGKKVSLLILPTRIIVYLLLSADLTPSRNRRLARRRSEVRLAAIVRRPRSPTRCAVHGAVGLGDGWAALLVPDVLDTGWRRRERDNSTP